MLIYYCAEKVSRELRMQAVIKQIVSFKETKLFRSFKKKKNIVVLSGAIGEASAISRHPAVQ